MLLKNISILLGKDLDYIQETNVQIKNQRFHRIQPNIHPSSNEQAIDCQGLLLIPGFINCHTHIGDSIAKDIGLDKSVDQKIHPAIGIKSRVLQKSSKSHIASFMQNTCNSMLRKGITTFVDFREGGVEGIILLRKALSKCPIRSIILGRIEHYQDSNQIKRNLPLPKEKTEELSKVLNISDGLGISGANENSNSLLHTYSKTPKLRAIHSSETKESMSTSFQITGKSETVRALEMKPHFLVHMTYASKSDLYLATRKTRGIVICPRANSSLAEGIPDIKLMLLSKCNIAIGTDNVMINSPDMFREMDYLWKVTMGIHNQRFDPKIILKMATVNAGKILRRDIGLIETGKLADCVLIKKHEIDIEPMHNPYASIVQRASESSIQAVMIGGKIVHGKI